MLLRRLRTEIRDILILIIAGLAMTWFGVSCRNCQEDSRIFWIMGSFTSLLWILLWKGNSYLGDLISRRISWIDYPVKRFVIGVIATVVYTVSSVYLLYIIYVTAFDISISIGVLISVLITFVISLFMHGREFLLNWRRTALEAEKYQQEGMAAKFESLKNQINPHFLFNSLNALTNLVYEDQEKASQFIRQLAEVYRYVLDSREREVVRLADELEFIRAYLFLQKIRFGDKLKVAINVQDETLFVAPLALQMLIENAIKHNIVSAEHPLEIEICSDDHVLVVKNNLQRKTSLAEPSSGVGLENIAIRYQILAQRNIEIAETSKHFTVRVPLLRDVPVMQNKIINPNLSL